MKLPFTPLYSTHLGQAYLGDSLAIMRKMPSETINLILTSPPYALHFKKEYGNKSQAEYVSWFMEFAKEFLRVLRPDGSLVIDLGGCWQQGTPTRSLYHFELLLCCARKHISTLLKNSIGTIPLSYPHLRNGSQFVDPRKGFGKLYLVAVQNPPPQSQ